MEEVANCNIGDCAKPAKGRRGMCHMHYKRWQKHGDPDVQFVNRVCEYCAGIYTPSNSRQKACEECSHLVAPDYSRRYEERRPDRSEWRASYNSKYYAKNKEAVKKQKKLWSADNRERLNASQRRRYSEMRDQRREYHRAYYVEWGAKHRARLNLKSHERRVRLKENGVFSVTPKDLNRLQERQRGECLYCKEVGILTLEHVIPVVLGGRHSVGNLVLACGACNRSKGGRTIMEWRVATGRVL